MSFSDNRPDGPPVFVPTQYPELKTLGSKAIHTFLRERERYLRLANEAAAQGSRHQPVSLVASVKFELLKALISLDTFEGVRDISSLTDVTLQVWLSEKDEKALDPHNLDELEAIIKKKLVMKSKEPDPTIRVMNLFADYLMLISDKKMEKLVQENPKVSISHICGALRPAALREKIQNDIALRKSTLGRDWKIFYAYVLEKTVALDEFLPAIEKTANILNTPVTRPAVRPAGNLAIAPRAPRGIFQKEVKEEPKLSTATSTAALRPQRNASNSPNSNLGAAKLEPKDTPLCLNKKACPGKHHVMRDCPSSSIEEKKRLVQEWRQARGASFKRVSGEPLSNQIVDSGGRISAKLADTVQVVVCGDYGADHAALCEEHLQGLAEAQIYVPTLPLAKPIQMNLAVEGSDKTFCATAIKKARISITLSLPEGPLRLQNVEFIVFKEKMSEVLLSRPLLVSMGFDLDAHLARVQDQYHDKDFSAVGFSPNYALSAESQAPSGRLARLLHASPEFDKPVEYLVDGDSLPADPMEVVESNMSDGFTIGNHVTTDIQPHLDRMVSEAMESGLSEDLRPKLRQILHEFADVFRLKLGTDPPVKFKPMQIRLLPQARPVSVKLRRYTPAQADFLSQKVTELERLGLVRRNPESAWACAPLLVRKPGPEKFRFTTDLRPVNKVTVPHVWPMPDLESSLGRLAGSTCFATIDLCQGYWQLPLDPDAQECQSFITPEGVYSPTRVMHGQKNAVAYCQSSIQYMCKDILGKFIQWLDDILFYARNPNDLFNSLELFLRLCQEFGLKLHAAKCQLFLTEVRWCGRIITGQGVKMDPSRLEALLQMQIPTKGDELQQFICAANWMRSSIPEFTTMTSPLSELLESVYKKAGRRTKQCVSKIILVETGWAAKHQQAFEKTKAALARAVTLAHPDREKTLCLFTDASDKHWSGTLTQIPQEDRDALFVEQRHEPLAFLCGSFTGSSARWSTPEKEAAAIIKRRERLDYLLLRPEGFCLFTDHSNLVFMYHPESVNIRMNKTIYNKVQRWGMILSMFQYTIVHIKGEDNCWADLLSRWGAKQVEDTPVQVEHLRIASLFRAPIAPELDPDFTWPSAADISEAQNAAGTNQRTSLNVHSEEGIWKTDEGQIWIPKESYHLQLRICIIGHCGRSGHRGYDATVAVIKEYAYWTSMREDLQHFCSSCLHCVSTIGGNRIPRPLGHALHADKPNEIIHFDFLYMGESTSGEEYIMIIKDDASLYTWLIATKEADSSEAAKALLKCFSAFGVAPTWISDRGSHFKNKLITEISRLLHTHHHFTAPNSPHANGTVERVCREELRCCRALLSEFRMKEKEWPSVIPIVQGVLNNSIHASIGSRAPITAFSGLPPDNPLRLIIPPKSANPKNLSEVQILRAINVESLLEALKQIHRDISERRNRAREDAVRRHNMKTHVQPANFSVGDYVLVAKRIANDGHKLKLKWLGPQRIVRIDSEWVYEVEDLINESRALVHANRLKFYSDGKLNITQEILDTIENNQPHYNTITKLISLKYDRKDRAWKVQAKWRGFAHEEPTWEPIEILHEDIPEMLRRFLDTYHDQEKVVKARRYIVRSGKRGLPKHQQRPSGTFQEGIECKTCPAGTYRNAKTSTDCIQCPSGTINPYTGALGVEYCRKCTQNTFSSTASTKCTPCPPGLISRPGSTRCLSCPAGSGLPPDNSNICQRCPPGFFSERTNSIDCKRCLGLETGPRGSRGPENCRPDFIRPCPVGMIPDPRPPYPDSCKKCPKDRIVKISFKYYCERCSEGTGTLAPGGMFCRVNGATKCPSRYSTTKTGDCISCPLLEFFDQDNQDCVRCPSGTFGNADSSGCMTCPDGQMPGPRKGECNCGAGNFRDSSGKCEPCAPGTSNESEFYDRKACFKCREGTFAAGQGNMRCDQCPIGSIPDKRIGATSCVPCPKGYMPSLKEDSAFEDRPYECVPIKSGCPGGSKRVEFTSGKFQTCEKIPCAYGTPVEEVGKSCGGCEPGDRLIRNGKCKRCPRNSVSDGGVVSRCKVCANGLLRNHFEKAKCGCLGYVLRGKGLQNGVCKSCPKGTFSDEFDEICRPCPKGSFTNQTGMAFCQNCPIGTFSDVEGSGDCKTCPVRTVSSFGSGSTECVSAV